MYIYLTHCYKKQQKIEVVSTNNYNTNNGLLVQYTLQVAGAEELNCKQLVVDIGCKLTRNFDEEASIAPPTLPVF